MVKVFVCMPINSHKLCGVILELRTLGRVSELRAHYPMVYRFCSSNSKLQVVNTFDVKKNVVFSDIFKLQRNYFHIYCGSVTLNYFFQILNERQGDRAREQEKSYNPPLA